MLTADGWFDWAERRPGPAWKVFAEINKNEGYVPHSMEGSYINALAILDSGKQSSWGSSNLKNGKFVQHYSVFGSTWTSGSKYPNTHFFTTENEGVAGEALTPAQTDNIVRVITELSERFKWTPRRPINSADKTASLYEHNECVRWGSEPTACPSGRIPWAVILKRLEDDMIWAACGDSPTGYRLYLMGTNPPTWVTDGGRAAALTKIHGLPKPIAWADLKAAGAG